MSSILRPPVDPALAQALAKMGMGGLDFRTKEDLERLRQWSNLDISAVLHGARADAIEHEEREIPGHEGAGVLTVSIFRPKKKKRSRSDTPGIFYVHGGGLCAGNRFLGISHALEWVDAFGAVCVTMEYRLAPEHPQPAQVEDCYAALKWMSERLL
ncbi:hypothetical protein VTN77DRAFT_5716 [Rasamsonia byssochlamydoides]|uniref:uncharacterized protein n=1 Tax=Rasamsonia byssochlamydoides TaxID=89139 RepID=UPI003742AE6F